MPNAATADDVRVVFITHANPEDNEFTSWLASRLTGYGYEVWTDLGQLRPGDVMWKDIDVALRTLTAKQVVILSKAASTKDGVRTEIDIGKAVGRSRNDERFQLPLRVDTVAYDAVFPQLIGRKIIDASGRWARGLHDLLEALERDAIPCSPPAGRPVGARWLGFRTGRAASLASVPEPVLTNWHLFKALPEKVFFYEIRRKVKDFKEVASIASALPFPAAADNRLLLAFADPESVSAATGTETPVALRHTDDLAGFLAGNKAVDAPAVPAFVAARHFASLLRQSFDCAMESRGLRAFELPAAGLIWWVPRSERSLRVTFTRPNGTSGWRALCGRSERLQRDWHFGVRAVPVVSEPLHFVLRPHVIFVRDGEVEGGDLRRAFCKAWFNARWRDLLLAFAEFVSTSAGQIDLVTGGKSALSLSSIPLSLQVPVSIPLEWDKPAKSGPTEEGDTDDSDGLDREADPFFRKQDAEEDPDGLDDQEDMP